MKADWKPEWAATGRTPTFVGGDGPSQVVFGGLKYLWGNVPAIDVLQLAKNEGSTYDQDLHLLFAASGDLRNVVKTLASIPDAFQKSISIVLNDRDPEIVIRNAILLLISLTAEDTKEAVDCMIHILYSAFIEGKHLKILQGKLRVLVAEVVQKIADKPAKSLQAKAWSFGSRNLRLVLTKKIWCELLERLDIPVSLTSQKAHQIRTEVTLAPSRRDYRERRYMCLLPALRLSQERYRTDGLLLPFGASRAPFDTPNPTLFESDQWPLKDSSDPLEGWNIFDIVNTTPRAAPSDVYGKLYFYLQHAFKAFIEKSISQNASFQLFNVDAEDLSKHLERGTFSRIEFILNEFTWISAHPIEVSNICDAGYLGYAKTLLFLGPLLQKQSTNPHATFIMLFMNAVGESLTPADQAAAFRRSMPQAVKYLPRPVSRTDPYDPGYLKYMLAADLFRDNDGLFNKYMTKWRFEEGGKFINMAMKKNTVVEKWPMRLKKKPGQLGAQEEFDLLFGSGHGNERYVEWQTVE
ncbi:LOW QUALITY PROTEIN: hypothetical protein MKX08_007587 [Trichoderma sp. CBMAI-0020]|nr:LOW QUALITY PROTEIN: hypothetical protein MKX08_007587 [Trichoderma sp. CBMAI-0020]